MTIEMMLQLAVLGLSIITMVANMVVATRLQSRLGGIPRDRRQQFRLFFTLQHAMMAFFLLGYIATIIALAMHYPLSSETFVSFIFLFGALFVAMVIWGELRLLDEINRVK